MEELDLMERAVLDKIDLVSISSIFLLVILWVIPMLLGFSISTGFDSAFSPSIG